MALSHHLPVIALMAILGSAKVEAETYTYPQLVQRMTDLQQLAHLPPAGEMTALASSYDRASQYDAAADKYVNWYATKDTTGIVRKEGDETVLADLQGAGCIWRITTNSLDSAHVKIYLDGSSSPAVDLPWGDYFSGLAAPFNRPNLVYEVHQDLVAHPIGMDNYTPISFAKSCKIVADKGWNRGYQFTYTLFPAGTVVPTFASKLAPDDAAALDHANQLLGQCGTAPSPAAGESTQSIPVHVAAGESATVADFSGAGAITALKVKLNLPKDPDAQRILLAQITLSITWDDEKNPAVWSPLGDFFGYVGGAIPFQSLPAGLLDDGTFYSYWYMPYGSKAHIVVGNDGPDAVDMTWQVSQAPLTQPIAQLARFHAKWHRDLFLPTRPDRQPDWTLLTTQGRGRYVGTHLHGWDPLSTLWGLGDDKFFVDGEKFPSSFGTGTENYFGYASRSAQVFSKPFHNQILNERNEDHFAENRWHIADAVPFQTSFDGFLEKPSPNARNCFYAAEAFWYLNAGGTDPYAAIGVADRIGWWTKPPVFHEAGVIESSTLFAANPPSSELMLINTLGSDKGYSGAHVLQWWPGKDENAFGLHFPVDKAGKYHFIVRYTVRMDHGEGILQLGVDGKPLGPPQLIYGPKDTLSPEEDLGLVDLTAGPHVMGIEYLQKKPSDKIGKAPYFGLDYIKLDPAP